MIVNIAVLAVIVLELVCIFSPLALLSVYIFFRPLLQPLATLKISFFGLPTTLFISALVIIASFVNALFQKGGVRSSLSGKLLSMITIVLAASSFFSINSYESYGMLLKFITGIAAFYLAIVAVKNVDDLVRLFRWITYAAIVPCLVAIYQFFTGDTGLVRFEQADRFSSVFGVVNAFGIFLSLIMCAAIGLHFSGKLTPRQRVLNTVTLVLCTCSQMLAQNRGTWIALTFAIIVSSLRFRRHLPLKKILICFAVVLVVFMGKIVSRFEQLDEMSQWGVKKNTFAKRVQYVSALSNFVFEKPVLGYGFGMATTVSSQYIGHSDPPHNDYLRMTLEAGFIASTLYMIFLLSSAISYFRNTSTTKIWWVVFSLSVSFVYILIISCVQNVYTSLVNFPLLLMLHGAGVSLISKDQHKECNEC